MPLIVISGFPSSGKTKRANELKTYFEKNGKTVYIVSEYDKIVQGGFDKNSFFLDSHKEKHIRGVLKSEVIRLIGQSNLVILDAGNYIKGYRYELYCATKANKCTQCTVNCVINIDEAWCFNENRLNAEEKYNRETFDALINRFEMPDYKNRWDSPLFHLQSKDEIDFSAVEAALYDKKLPKPNQSTQNAPLCSNSFLYQLDCITKEVTEIVISAKQLDKTDVVIKSDNGDLNIENLDNVTVQQLTSLKRQFINYTKMHPKDVSQLRQLYVQFLNSSI